MAKVNSRGLRASFGSQSLIFLFLLSFYLCLVEAFNLEVRVPIIKQGNHESYFGYSVAQHQTLNDNYSKSWSVVLLKLFFHYVCELCDRYCVEGFRARRTTVRCFVVDWIKIKLVSRDELRSLVRFVNFGIQRKKNSNLKTTETELYIWFYINIHIILCINHIYNSISFKGNLYFNSMFFKK